MANLMDTFSLTDRQADAILNMRLQRLTSMEVEKLNEELIELNRMIEDYKDILAKPERVNAIIKEDLAQIKSKYGVERKTEIGSFSGVVDADLIDREDVVISMTHLGYVKRIPVEEYRAQHRGGRGVTAHKTKEEDFVNKMFVCSTHDKVLFFSDKGKVFIANGYDIPEAQRTARGRAIVNFLQLAEGEKITAMLPWKEGADGFIIIATKQGLIKKTAVSEFESIRRGGKIAITLREDDEVISVEFTDGEQEMLMAASSGKCIRFSEKDIRETGRGSQGVKSMNLSSDEVIVDMLAVKQGYDILTISERGYGKRTDIDEYRLQSRGGKGTKAGVFDENTGKLVNLKLVLPEEDIMIITENGIIIRTAASEISKIGRNTKGVRIMRIEEDKIVTVAITDATEEEIEEAE